jgi:ISXO2-like transposase domain
MIYDKLNSFEFFKQVNTEEKARSLVWRAKYDGKEFICPCCGFEQFFQYISEPEIRKCKGCSKHVRLRKDTMFENSKKWVWALFLVMQSKRGISALELKRQLGMSSYGTVWSILQKIRTALQSRDERYKLNDIIELDGAQFGRQKTKNDRQVLVAVETKSWVDEKGRAKSKAGFAKVIVARENLAEAQDLINQHVAKGSHINTDASLSFRQLKGVHQDFQEINGDQEKVDHWLPWVHKFISNAKSWIIGTHHGVEGKYLHLYLAEYTYRFNRRHDPNGLFHRALTACAVSKPVTYGSLFG